MRTMEEAWSRFVEQYEIEVPAEKIENEYQYVLLEMKHRMQYDTLINHNYHWNASAELEEQEASLRQIAYQEAKSDLVMKEMMKIINPAVTKEELETEAAALAKRQNSSIEMVRRFFGEDLRMLERDLKERKIKEGVCSPKQHTCQ